VALRAVIVGTSTVLQVQVQRNGPSPLRNLALPDTTPASGVSRHPIVHINRHVSMGPPHGTPRRPTRRVQTQGYRPLHRPHTWSGQSAPRRLISKSHAAATGRLPRAPRCSNREGAVQRGRTAWRARTCTEWHRRLHVLLTIPGPSPSLGPQRNRSSHGSSHRTGLLREDRSSHPMALSSKEGAEGRRGGRASS